jgi:outer membrane protein assembly factor BamB
MWAKPLEAGGVVGGSYEFAQGVTFYTGLSYEGRFSNPLIVNGRLYYDSPLGNNAASGPYMAVDLRTGQTIWENPNISPSFGQLYMYDTPNQHGVIPSGMLWQTSGTTWMAYDPLSGQNIYNLTNVPNGVTVYGSNGEITRYVLNYGGRWLALWNNTAAPELSAGTGDLYSLDQWRPFGKSVNASTAYSWNVTIPNLPGLANPSILSVIPNDLIIGASTNFAAFTAYLTPDPYTFWAISLKPATRGQLLWIRNYTAPAGNLTLNYLGAPNAVNLNLPVDPVNRVFFVEVKETSQWYGYDLDSGNILWGPVGEFRATQFFGTTSNPPAIGYPAYGKLYVAGYGGILYAFDAKTGNLLWTYGNGGTGNSTYSVYETPWGYYPIFVSTIADGKIYLFTGEHSPNVPPYKGSRMRAVNATTGEEIWTMMGWHASGGFGQWAAPIADGHLIFYNVYDARLYSIGKGPSDTTVTIQNNVITQGSSILIQGTVTDISPGTNQAEQAARFPDGVPAVSDQSQGKWMEYVYMQKPRPMDAIGVDVIISVVDANGNYREIGTVTSNADGFFTYNWKPDIPGQYTVYTSFAGSESYWPSHAVSSFAVDPAPEATTAPTAAPQSAADMYFLPVSIGMFIAIVIVAILLALLLLKKRP